MRNELNVKLDQAKRNFDIAVSIKTNLLLTVPREARNSEWEELYYFSPNANGTAKLQRLWEAYRDTTQAQSLGIGLREIGTCVGQIVVKASVFNTYKAEKEAAKNAPKPVKVVPPNQLTLAAALSEARVKYIARIHTYVTADADAAFAKLSQHGWDLEAAAPYPLRDANRWDRLAQLNLRGELARFTVQDKNRVNADQCKTDYRRRRSDLAEFIKSEAERIGGFNFDSFVCKLTRKIEAAAKAEGTDKPVINIAVLKGVLWDGCTLTVALNGGTQTWVTKCIINRSVLGKLFNQWPTRRSS